MPRKLICFGYPQLLSARGEPIRIRTRKHLALLIYLAVEPPIRHRRDYLAHKLWPRVGQAAARHSLATALSALRNALPPKALITTHELVMLDSGHLRTDLALLQGDDPHWDEIQLTGPFLEDFEISDAPDFDLWRHQQTALLQPTINRVFNQWIAQALEKGRHSQAERLIRRLSRITGAADPMAAQAILPPASSPLGPGLHLPRLVPNKQPTSGNHPVRTGHGASAGSGPLCSEFPPNSQHQPIFLGRDAELQAGLQALQRAWRREPVIVMIRGERGIGRSSFLSRLIQDGIPGGGSRIVETCCPTDQRFSFSLVARIIERLICLRGAAGATPETLARLSCLTPQIGRRFPGVSRLREADDALPDPLIIAAALHELISCVAHEGPLLLAIDDLHYAAGISRDIILNAIRRLEDLPVALIATITIAADRNGGFEPWQQISQSVSLDLMPLNRDEIATIVQDALPDLSQPLPVLGEILDSAGGNPWIARFLTHDWCLRGYQSLAVSRGRMDSGEPDPETVRLLETRYRDVVTIDSPAGLVAGMAALLGRRLGQPEYYRPVGLPPPVIMLELGKLHRDGVFSVSERGYQFTDVLLENYCYHLLPNSIRKLLHRQVADQILQSAGDAIDHLEAARHLIRSGDPSAASPHLLQGAMQAIDSGNAEAADLALATGLNYLTGDAQVRGLLLRVQARQEVGKWQESLNLLNQLPRSPESATLPLTRVLRIKAEIHLGHIPGSRMDQSIDELLRIACMQIPIEIRCEALSTLPIPLAFLGQASLWQRVTVPIQQLLGAITTPQQCLQLLYTQAQVENATGDAEPARRTLTKALVCLSTHQIHNSMAVRVLSSAGAMSIASGDYHGALPDLHRAVEIAGEIGNCFQLSTAAASLATVYGRLARHEEQLEWAEQALRLLPARGFPIIAAIAAYEKALALTFLPRPRMIREGIDDLKERIEAVTNPIWLKQIASLMLADILALNGEQRRAIRRASQVVTAPDERLLSSESVGRLALWSSLVSSHHGNEAESLDQLNRWRGSIARHWTRNRAELLSSILYLQQRVNGEMVEDDVVELKRLLGCLPPMVEGILHRLGLSLRSTSAVSG